jgi:predicted MPP superfamily phosphohydrolase
LLKKILLVGLELALFLLAFLLIYGGMHFHFFLRAASAFDISGIFRYALAVFLLAGLTAPIAMRIAEGRGYDAAARLVSIAGYYWMAFLLLFFFVSIFIEFYHFILTAASKRLHCDCGFFIFGPSPRFLIPVVLSIIFTIYGSFEAQNLKTEHLFIRSEKIPKEAGVIRIVQISDVHIGGALRGSHLPTILRAVRDAFPDVLVSTGDIVDGQGTYVEQAALKFREIRPKWGKFAITGNHEFYLGLNKALKFMDDAGFVPLRNRAVAVAGVLDLVGVDDHGGMTRGEPMISDREILSREERSRFTVLLKHRPVVESAAIGLFDLQLSGHTHKGQIFPFSIFTKLAFPYHAGDYRLPGGALLHVSRGAGVWGPPIRLLAPPEITVIDLTSR